MSRIIVTDKFGSLGLNTPKSSPILTNKNISQTPLLSTTRRVKATLDFTTSHDIYYQNSQEIFTIANKELDLKDYLKKKQQKKTEPNTNLRYINQKISHIAKIVKVTGEKDKEIYTDKSRRLDDQKNSILYNDSFAENSMVKKNELEKDLSKNKNSSNILFQKRYNQILYCENYLDRLNDRYQNYQKTSEIMKKTLKNTIDKHWEEQLKVKTKKAEEKLGEIEKKLKGDEKEIVMMQTTNANIRLKNRMEKIHKRKYMSDWNKQGLPSIGHAYGLKNLEKARKFDGNLKEFKS